MSLFIQQNKATDKQKAFLEKLGYIGRGQYALDNLSFQEASDLITELLEEQQPTESDEGDKYSWDY